ncbi:MAG TPA: asparagine synthetase B [Candidatus Wallbacteria bacterium]|nr:asparagine synthetase B [Candidatus Wallbacteria bacterium]
MAIINIAAVLTLAGDARAEKILIYMDRAQNDHLKAYGVVYKAVAKGIGAEWLLNYRNGSFLMDNADFVRETANYMGVSFETIGDDAAASIYSIIKDNNMDAVKIEKSPKIAVYSPPDKRPWDDAVTLALTYAEIPYDTLWDSEVLKGDLKKYDWLHLHHEDFTGQYGKFYGAYKNAVWYQKQVRLYEQNARDAGFKSVQAHKCAVAKTIKKYVEEGGFLFMMCCACDSIDIALAADGVDIIPSEIDGTPADPNCQQKLDFSKTFAFKDFTLEMDPYVYEFSDIDIDANKYFRNPLDKGDFTLFEFSAKLDRAPTILTQSHEASVKAFLGQSTAFKRKCIKDSVIILGQISDEEVKYLYSTLKEGSFTFYGGHDPEDFAHEVGSPATNVSLHKNSAGYRLILNNILFPAVKKKKLKT